MIPFLEITAFHFRINYTLNLFKYGLVLMIFGIAIPDRIRQRPGRPRSRRRSGSPRCRTRWPIATSCSRHRRSCSTSAACWRGSCSTAFATTSSLSTECSTSRSRPPRTTPRRTAWTRSRAAS